MTTETAAQRARGMRDLLPEQMERIRLIEDAFRATCAAWGYREVRTPIVEPLYLFTSAGTLSPKTLDHVYSFLDWDGWSGERVVLRPDSTIAAARLYAENLDGGRVAKLCYSQSVVRFADDDSAREEWQCGVELIGDTGVTGDLEGLLLALDVLGKLPVAQPSVRLSHVGVVRAVLAAAGLSDDEQSATYDRLLDGDLAAVDEVEARLPQLDAPLRRLFEVDGAGSAFITEIRAALAGAIPAIAAPLDELALVAATLEARGVAPLIQAALVRSFEYYSGIVFKIDVDGERVCTGGRYDGLIELIGGKRVPAAGFAFYLVPLTERLRDRAQAAAPAITVQPETVTPELLAASFNAAARLRQSGIAAAVAAENGASVRLTVRASSPRYALTTSRGTTTFDSIDDAAREAGQSR